MSFESKEKATRYNTKVTTYQPEAPTGFTKDLLSVGELTPSEFKALLDLADTFKTEREQRRFNHQVPGTSLALLFERPSTRTRVSFEVGMFELGGHAVVLNSNEMQSVRGETASDTARVLSRYCQAIAARVASHETLEKFAGASTVPVINALSDKYHPCQSIADILTIRQYKRKLKGLKLAWVGDGNNVCNSLVIAASLCGAHVNIACPKKYEPLQEALSIAHHQAEFSDSIIDVMESPAEAVDGADAVLTDTFVSMGEDGETEERLKKFLPQYQVTDQLMSMAKPDAIFLHCLPAHRGQEVSSIVIDGPQSVVWQEAENRLHVQKSILYSILKRYAKNSKDKFSLNNRLLDSR
jgi:ornithine carbamoyltransferase